MQQFLSKFHFEKIHTYLKSEIMEKVYFVFQILEHPNIGKYWNISGVPVLCENVIFISS